ncbi:MAG: porin family protein [Prevotella sp.]
MTTVRIFIISLAVLLASTTHAQERTVENRPYTDLRPFHFGVVVGAHMQDIELNNIGPITLTDENGMEYESFVSADQDRWDPGFQVGVLGELRLSAHFALRLSPTLYFGTRHITFLNHTKPTETGEPTEARQTLKSVYIAGVADIIFSAKRFNNHRPYIVAGITPMLNLTSRDNDYLRLKSSDVYLSVGAGCDFYLPFFKLRPELKFMYSLTNSLDGKHASQLKDQNMMPYARSVDKARTKMICLSFYFE